jgi:hypothetical protein
MESGIFTSPGGLFMINADTRHDYECQRPFSAFLKKARSLEERASQPPPLAKAFQHRRNRPRSASFEAIVDINMALPSAVETRTPEQLF